MIPYISNGFLIFSTVVLLIACHKEEKVIDEAFWVGTWEADRRYSLYNIRLYKDGARDTYFIHTFRDTAFYTFTLEGMLEIYKPNFYTDTLCWYYREYDDKIITILKGGLYSDIDEYDLVTWNDHHQEWQVNSKSSTTMNTGKDTSYMSFQDRFLMNRIQ